jgi:DNA-directed RNA polymerase specialized sigma24 family protein
MSGGGNHGRRFSAAERTEIHQRIANGQTHGEVADAMGCSTKSIQRLLAKTGGIRRRCPPDLGHEQL